MSNSNPKKWKFNCNIIESLPSIPPFEYNVQCTPLDLKGWLHSLFFPTDLSLLWLSSLPRCPPYSLSLGKSAKWKKIKNKTRKNRTTYVDHSRMFITSKIKRKKRNVDSYYIIFFHIERDESVEKMIIICVSTIW